ncbi:MAG: peptide chain release factor N(5)-glutamine methyltransferase [Alistipes sp.]|nr:peptide chain release factor N(5)-glutamine methyltransferase [Alistipes sp.]MBR3591178.1 peptide chain release factor N(5)-glutamine methyltransferase [Alistipes sp.]MBR6632260.1 peptide chain release factor N(5)-glutamine methyltransferase [Alistipes sp.]
MATRREIFRALTEAGAELYGEAEARQIAEMVLESRGVSRNMLLVDPNEVLQFPDLDSVINDIRAWRPVQYIIGTAEFAGMDFEVSDAVLIPRPETEELVDWIASEVCDSASILDVGTGSGCIAIALSRAVSGSSVWALDISADALAVARRNGAKYAPDVRFVEGDALSDFSALFAEKFDVVVSNPPYIPDSDSCLMRRNVTDYEPHTALFVPDNNPLLFYRSIARTALRMLKAEGKLYFEIYELLADEMQRMLQDEGYEEIVVREDFRGKPRMICARVSSTTK